MSSFAEILQDMVERIPGAVGAVFADWEGEAVDQFAHIPPVDIQLVGAHWGVVLHLAGERLRGAGVGEVEELWIESQNALVLVRTIADRYYVVLTARSGTHLGTARRELARSAQTL